MGRILLRNHATVLVSLKDGTIKIRNLQENKAYSVQVFLGHQTFQLYAGQELVASSSFDKLSQSASSDGLQRRRMNTLELSDGTNVMRCEFSPVTLIKSTPVLKSLVSSNFKPESRAFEKVLKMAACLSIVTESHGNFAPVTAQTQQIATISGSESTNRQ